jgi:2-desacetyl-2-hydroxyethyl bacteriochlorophyllide A dehydrogenase
MHAVYLKQYGPPGVLECGELAKPQPTDGGVVIQVYAAGINPIDRRIRSGSLRCFLPAKFPLILGFDVSGVVTEVGSAVRHVKPGDEVYCMLDQRHGSGYAEFAVASADVVAPKPAGLSHCEAAAVPLAACTALQALRDLGGITEGQRVLINGASGGVGTFAVQLGKVFGAEVTGVCSTANVDLVKELGADQVVDYKTQDFTRDQRKYDIVFDAVAKSSFVACRRILKTKGHYIRTVPSPSHILFRGLTKVWRRKLCQTIWVSPSGHDLRFLKDLIENGKVRPIIDQVFPLKDACKAHELSQAGHVKGKLVLQVIEANG